MPPIHIRKAYGYITRTSQGQTQVAVFRHPLLDENDEGIQIPKGTVHENETPREAVQREIIEETGLNNFTVEREIAVDLWQLPTIHARQPEIHERHFFLLTAHSTLETWDHTVTGQGEDAGMVFHYYWIRSPNEVALATGHGDYLHLILL